MKIPTPVEISSWAEDGYEMVSMTCKGKRVYFKDAEAEVALRVNLHDELVEVLCHVVQQDCWCEKEQYLDSMCLYQDELRLLAKLGKAKILREGGRRVIAEWVEEKA